MNAEELMDEKELKRVLGKVYDDNCVQGYGIPHMMLLGARAVLEGVGVSKVVEAGPGEIRLGVEPGEFLAELPPRGAILIRAKRNDER